MFALEFQLGVGLADPTAEHLVDADERVLAPALDGRGVHARRRAHLSTVALPTINSSAARSRSSTVSRSGGARSRPHNGGGWCLVRRGLGRRLFMPSARTSRDACSLPIGGRFLASGSVNVSTGNTVSGLPVTSTPASSLAWTHGQVGYCGRCGGNHLRLTRCAANRRAFLLSLVVPMFASALPSMSYGLGRLNQLYPSLRRPSRPSRIHCHDQDFAGKNIRGQSSP